MSLDKLAIDLEQLFSCSKVAKDFFYYCVSQGMVSEGRVECVFDDETVNFPVDAGIDVVSRSAEFVQRPLITNIKVLVAVGGILSESNGISEAKYLFAKLYYGDLGEPYSVEMDTCQFSL